MQNYITAAFSSEGGTGTTAEGLWQWDYGQLLKISGLRIQEDHVQVHFAPVGGRKALIRIGEVDSDGDIIVPIPDELLRKGEDLFAYIYVADEIRGETTHEIRLPVKRRAKPQEYDAPDEKNALEQILTIAKGKADGLSLDGGNLQLTAQGEPIGQAVSLPGGGGAGVEEITNQEIDNMMKE